MDKKNKMIYTQIKENIEMLINQSKLQEAQNLLDQYKNITHQDIDVYSIQAVLYIKQGMLDEAKTILNEGLAINKTCFDLLFNLAYIYEFEKKYSEAIQIHLQISRGSYSSQQKSSSQEALQHIRESGIEIKEKKKITIFVKKGMDSFIGEIIEGLSSEYEIKKVLLINLSQIENEMRLADICWFEWCDELVVHGSNLEIAKDKVIICRIHGYEVYSDFITQAKWENVNQLIVVAPHILRIFKEKVDIELLKYTKVDLVYCGVNLEMYPLVERKKGYNIGYLGYINFKKNIPLTLDIFYQLHLLDSRYQLHLAGQFQDERTLRYLQFFINEYNLHKHIFFDGWQDQTQKIKWFQKIDYMLISSIDEGLCYAAAEAMVSGIKPVLHKCEGLKDHYPEEYLFTTQNQAIKMITDKKYTSKRYRQFIENTYSLEKQADKLRKIISELETNANNSNRNKAQTNFGEERLTLNYIMENFSKFSPYQVNNYNDYKFDSAQIMLGRREKINDSFEIIETIVKNNNGNMLVITNIWYDVKGNKLTYPREILESNNFNFIDKIIQDITKYSLSYTNNIAGFIFDKELIKNINKNQLAYSWERAVPASQFAPMIGYLRVAERYIFAGSFINKESIILEAPCGFGYGAAYFSKLCKRVEALDLASENIDFGKNAYDFSNVNWVVGDVTKLPYLNEEFDFYISYEVFEHLPLEIVDAYLSEAKRIIKKDGKFIISTPNIETRRHIKNPFHIKEYNFAEFSALIERYFNKIEYYYVKNFKVERGIDNLSYNMIAVCMN